MFYHLTVKSRNIKTGAIPVSTSSALTCPDACPLKRGADGVGGCYAEGGPLGMFWRKVTEGKAGTSFESFVAKVKELPKGQLWRHNQSGDLIPSKEGKEFICSDSLYKLVTANQGKRGFTYTHYNPLKGFNKAILKTVNHYSEFTVNLSGNNFDHADELASLDCGPVVTVAPIEYERRHKKEKGVVQWLESFTEYKKRIDALGLTTKAGRRIIVCPATYSDTVNCKSCALCQKQRETIVAFPAHGSSKRKADAIATAAA
tara:strand:- start:269 stop:1045 length:777 start_codon:yes stop_codon:yes gene_type:complete